MKQFTDLYSENATTATFSLGFDAVEGKFIVKTRSEEMPGRYITWGSFIYNGNTCTLSIGDAHYNSGKIVVGTSGATTQAILIDGTTSSITVGGKNGGNGVLTLKNKIGNQSFDFNSGNGTLTLGGLTTTANEVNDGNLILKDYKGIETIKMEGRYGNLTLGGGANDGDILIKNATGANSIQLDGNDSKITVGGVGSNGNLVVKNSSDIETIRITGADGDITFSNADFAEEFDIAETAISHALPGMVMKLGEDGKLIPADMAYDGSVVGVIAGAGDFKPAVIMDKKGGDFRRPVAMVGKVFCFVDADIFPIQTGDMLTSSPVKGHAMKATDRERAFGAVIGKALGSLASGRGLIPVLVNLQ